MLDIKISDLQDVQSELTRVPAKPLAEIPEGVPELERKRWLTIFQMGHRQGVLETVEALLAKTHRNE